MQANPEDDLFGFTMFTVALGNGLLELNRSRQCIDCAGKFYVCAIARQLDQPATVSRERWFEALPAMLAQARQRAALVAAHQAGVADNVCGEDRCQFAELQGPEELPRIAAEDRRWPLRGNRAGEAAQESAPGESARATACKPQAPKIDR